jgi:diguanylate cyclase (GGDEF)-like protein
VSDQREQYTEADYVTARADVRRGVKGVTAGLLVLFMFTGAVGGALGGLVSGSAVVATALWCAVTAVAVGGPLVLLFSNLTQRRGLEIGLENAAQGRRMETEARRREFETRLSRALEMAGDEAAAYDMIERAVAAAIPGAPTELLLADNSQAHLERVLTVPADGEPPGCGVRSPSECVAARRAQTQCFADSEALDACPFLRGRERGDCSAVCVPVSIMGRTVGVLHTVGEVQVPLDDDAIGALQVLANQAGNRLGMLRIMSETQLQASTDGLTGLVNRRSFENRARQLRAAGQSFALVFADLDRFKNLNDAYGHETGDRALRVFAEVLRSSLRADDLACRYGGEEFVVLIPGVQIPEAIEAMQRVRAEMRRVARGGDSPAVTASFGIAHSDDAEDIDDLVHRADRALFAAKDAGRDCICIDGHRDAVASNLTAIN